MKVGIVGLGHVGSAMKELFTDAVVYDKYKNIGTQEDVCRCDLAFVCVPTPQGENGKCDTSAVDEVLRWIKVQTVVIRSTVPVGYTEWASVYYHQNIVFQPEYYGETPAHPFADLRGRKWIVLGGKTEDRDLVVEAYQQVYNADVHFYFTDSKTAELAKYMANTYFATKVTFCNEFYEIAKAEGINYNELREIWTADPRIGNYHTFVYPHNRGFGGSCLPKDISALIYLAERYGVDVSLLKAVKEKNRIVKGETDEITDSNYQA